MPVSPLPLSASESPHSRVAKVLGISKVAHSGHKLLLHPLRSGASAVEQVGIGPS